MVTPILEIDTRVRIGTPAACLRKENAQRDDVLEQDRLLRFLHDLQVERVLQDWENEWDAPATILLCQRRPLHMEEVVLREDDALLLPDRLDEDLWDRLYDILLDNDDVVPNLWRDRVEVSLITSGVIVVDFHMLTVPTDDVDTTGILIVDILRFSLIRLATVWAAQSKRVVGEDPMLADLVSTLLEPTRRATQVLLEGEAHADERVAVGVVVEPELDLHGTEPQVILEVFLPTLADLCLWMIDDQVSDRILTELEDSRVNQWVRQEVVPTPAEQLLDRVR